MEGAGTERGDGPIGGYHVVARLGEGGMGTVFRAKHAQTGQHVALKLALSQDPIAVESVRREIRLLARIRHPGVVGLLDHGVHDLRPWYAMELVEGESLATWLVRRFPRQHARDPNGMNDGEVPDASPDQLATRPIRGTTPSGRALGDDSRDQVPAVSDRPSAAAGRLADVLQLFARLSQTLGYLHGEGIVHLDLKPSNILLRADAQPVLVDFGITRQVAGGLNREVLNVDPLHGGTEMYMAPEQITGAATDARTDLYALGCIFYEALTGRPPFLGSLEMSVSDQHLGRQPRPISDWVSGVPEDVERCVHRLLAKSPADRIGYAGDVLDVLVKAGAYVDPELAVRKPKPYLYRPPLIGRDALMTELRGELVRARKGNGRCVFVMGPSGAGKTRVMMELGREAYSLDMRVVSGECTPVAAAPSGTGRTDADLGSSPPLHPFSSLLATVVDLCNAGGPDTTAALVGDALPVLENLEPALARIAGRDRFPETLSATSAFGRTEQALSATIVATAKQKPLLLVIDDLQWADALSHAVISALTRLPDTGHVCCVITCRSDEASPATLELTRASSAVRYELEPLGAEAVSRIVGGMIANDQAPTELVRFIGERARGNPFFVAEYLQAAVYAGALRRDADGRWVLGAVADGAVPLPDSPELLLSRRIADLDARRRAVLERAAVLGRTFTRSELFRKSPALEEVEDLLHRGILVESGPRELRFSHDKLREAAYAGIPPERRARLHAEVAAELQAEDAGLTTVQQLAYAATLAHHFACAGMKQEHFVHARRAGELANRVGAHHQARGLLREALDLAARDPPVTAGLSKADLARLWGTYGSVLETLGDVDDGVPALEHGLALLGHKVPAGGVGLAAFIASQLVRQLVRRVRGAPSAAEGGAKLDAHADDREAADVAAALARGYIGSNKQLNVIGAVLLSANLAERSHADASIVHSSAFLGGIAGLVGLGGVAAGYFGRARAAAQRDGTMEAALTLAQLEGFYFMSHAAWARAAETLTPILERALAASALHLAEPPLLMMNYVHMLQGDLVKAGELTGNLLQAAKKTGNERTFLIGSLALALHDLYRGQFASALAQLDALEQRFSAFHEVIHVANFHATRAGLLSFLGRHDEAVEVADRAASLLTDARNALTYNVHAFTPETYLRAHAFALSEGRDAAALAARARKAVTAARKFSSVCGYAAPLATRFRGEVELASGNVSRGVRRLVESVAIGERQNNVYEIGMAARALARASVLPAAERERWARRAEGCFVRLGHHPFIDELAQRRAVAIEGSPS